MRQPVILRRWYRAAVSCDGRSHPHGSDDAATQPEPDNADHHHDAAKVSRDYRLHLDTQQAIMLSVLGGKLTTCRTLAEEAVDQLGAALGRSEPAWTAGGPALPGGDGGSVEALLPALQAAYPQQPEALLRDLARRHGSRARAVLGEARSPAELGRHFGAGLYEREVDYLIEQEWAVELDDLLWRRTHLGLRLDAAQRAALAAFLQQRHAAIA